MFTYYTFVECCRCLSCELILFYGSTFSTGIHVLGLHGPHTHGRTSGYIDPQWPSMIPTCSRGLLLTLFGYLWDVERPPTWVYWNQVRVQVWGCPIASCLGWAQLLGVINHPWETTGLTGLWFDACDALWSLDVSCLSLFRMLRIECWINLFMKEYIGSQTLQLLIPVVHSCQK